MGAQGIRAKAPVIVRVTANPTKLFATTLFSLPCGAGRLQSPWCLYKTGLE
jgi:hypothetical protein